MTEDIKTSETEDKAENMPDTKQSVQGSQTDEPDNPKTEAATAAPRKKKRLAPWLFLLVIFVGAPAAWFLSPPDMRHQAQDAFDQITSRIGHIIDKTNGSNPTASAVQDKESMAAAQDQADAATTKGMQDNGDVAATESNAPLMPKGPDLSPANEANPSSPPATLATQADAMVDASDLNQMRQKMKQLQNELSTTLAERDTLRAQLLVSQQRELSSRLQWISRSETTLAQRADLWGEIVSLPGLSEEDRNKATQMAKLANEQLALIKTWRNTLSRLAESLPDARHADIIPKPENPYLAWLFNTFHLRPAPGKSELLQTSLRRHLLDMEHALSREDWPEENEWKTLIADLHEQFGADTDSGLHESLLPALREIKLLRETANSWLEAL